MGWTGPTGIASRELIEYVVRNDVHIITLDGFVIEKLPHQSLAEKVFAALSGRIFDNNESPHFKGGNLSRSEYVEIQEERIGRKLSGTLQLFHKSTGKVLDEVII